jgi:hypothetical protein
MDMHHRCLFRRVIFLTEFYTGSRCRIASTVRMREGGLVLETYVAGVIQTVRKVEQGTVQDIFTAR